MVTADDKPSYLDVNPNERTPCVLVLDASGSMGTQTSGGSTGIDALNRGLKILEAELKSDPTAKTHVQVAIVCVGGAAGDADVLMDWTDANAFQAFPLVAGGRTPLGKGLLLALQTIETQKQAYRAQGIKYLRPWMMVITDGEPTDEAAEWRNATAACRAAESVKKCVIYPIGVEGVNVAKLQEISSTPVLLLDKLKFVELFQWLSSSLGAIVRSKEGDTVQLPSTGAWAAVQL